MPLPANFRFSQASLADYLDCPRRFQLRYLLEQAWPAVESEPLLERERLAELGRRFHKLIQQHVEGLSAETLAASLGEPELARWWQSYLDSLTTTLSDLPERRRAEVAMSIPITAASLRGARSATEAISRSPRRDCCAPFDSRYTSFSVRSGYACRGGWLSSHRAL